MASSLSFYYFGDDQAYFRALQEEFRCHTKLPITFKKFYESQEEKIQSFFIKVFNEKPDCVFIDFSKNTQDYLHLARILSRTPLQHKMVLIGLVDYLSPSEVLNESIATGTNLSFIKSAETFDVIFGVTKLLAPKEISTSGLATAKLDEEWEGGIICKVGYIHSEGIHIETNFKLGKGETIRIKHYWMNKKIVPSPEVFVNEVSSSNLFYHYKYNSDLTFKFINPITIVEGMEEKEIIEKESEREELILYSKKHLNKWLIENLDRSKEKKAKVVIVDRSFKFFEDQTRTDKHSYTIRCIPFFSDYSEELDRLRPQVLAINLDTSEDPKNTLESTQKLIQVLKAKYQDLNPFIIVFNCPLTSPELQEELKYSQIIAYKDELSVGIMMRMADIFEKKLSQIIQNKEKFKNCLFIPKTNLASIAEIMTSIKVIKISEVDMIIQSAIPISPGTNIHLETPVNMFVNIQPMGNSDDKKGENYYGLIHCLGENEKKTLRKYVNSIFFRDHDAQIQSETDEFKALNEQKLQEKLELIKKAEEQKILELNEKVNSTEEPPPEPALSDFESEK